ncbi:Mss4-like protein [Penicillium chermesinum]|nr:Mss4-like protein [Penicillium chermesinum]
MPAGSCFCKNVRVEYDGEPIVTVSIPVREEASGILTQVLRYPKSADSGNSIKNYFCPDCGMYRQRGWKCALKRRGLTCAGTPLYGHKLTSSGEPDEATVLRAGILDDVDVIQQQIPGVELYTARRICWVKPFEEAIQSEGMLPAR